MIRTLLAVIPQLSDATSFYRAAGPLAEMKRVDKDLWISCTTDHTWATINMSDAVFMQRPYTKGHLVMAEMVKAQYKPLWVDYDDDIFSIPTDNPAKWTYEENQTNMAKIIALADVVTVTTEHLKQRFQMGKRPLNKNIKVVPNAIDLKLFPYRMEGQRNKVIIWRGSRTHQRDVMSYSEPILTSSKDKMFSEWLWHFIGDREALWFLTDYMPGKNTTLGPAVDTIDYFRHIHDIRPSAIQVPLHDSDFNKAKSNIAWIEGSFAGAVTIAPDWEQWNKPGVLTYKNQAEYKAHLDALACGAVDVIGRAKLSWEHICDEYNLTKWAKARLDILNEIMG